MKELILNTHNKLEHEPSHTGESDSSLTLRFVCLLALLFISAGVNAQQILPMSDTLSIDVDGKEIKLSCTYRGEYGSHYETWEPFVERGTCYLYRSIDYSLDNESVSCDTSSYYVLSHKSKAHLKDVDKVNYAYSRFKAGDEEYMTMRSGAKDYLTSTCPELEPNRLGNMPRKWYQLKKYGDNYYYSVDSNDVREFYNTMVLFYGMELWCEALTDFKRLSGGGWEYTLIDPGFKRTTKVSARPARHLKEAYIITESIDDSHPVMSLWTTDKGIKRFDIIQWESTYGKEIGLPYEEIDFESIK